MAQRLSINKSTYSNYENNIREPNLEVIEKIAKELGINVFELLSEKEAVLGLTDLKTKELNDSKPNVISSIKFLKTELLEHIHDLVDDKTYSDICKLFVENQCLFYEKKHVINNFKQVCEYAQIDLSNAINKF